MGKNVTAPHLPPRDHAKARSYCPPSFQRVTATTISQGMLPSYKGNSLLSSTPADDWTPSAAYISPVVKARSTSIKGHITTHAVSSSHPISSHWTWDEDEAKRLIKNCKASVSYLMKYPWAERVFSALMVPGGPCSLWPMGHNVDQRISKCITPDS